MGVLKLPKIRKDVQYMSKTRLMITCPKCNKQTQGKRVMLGYVASCSCGYIFTEEDKQKALEEVRVLRKLEKQK